MSTDSPEFSLKWLSFSCPACRAQLQIKARYAAMRGQCPECGCRIEPLQSSAGSTSDDGSEKLLGLVPIEDEWPEPARVAGAKDDESYGIAAEPPVWPDSSPLTPRDEMPAAGGYRLAADDLPPSPQVLQEEPEREAYPVFPAKSAALGREAALPDPRRVQELLPEPPPPPPPFPLWSGIYAFPWRPNNLGVWFFQALNFSLMSFLIVGMLKFLDAGGAMIIGVVLIIPMVALAFFWSGIYATNCFIANVEETAAGNDLVAWPRGGGLLDGFGKFFYLLWIIFCSAIPVIFIVAAQYAAGGNTVASGKPGVLHNGLAAPDSSAIRLGWLVPVMPWVLLFPILLLSSLKGGWWWHVLDGKIAGGIFRKPRALFLVCIPSVLLILPSVYLAQALIVGRSFSYAFLSGILWSSALLIYGRLLGRAGWIIIGQGTRA